MITIPLCDGVEFGADLEGRTVSTSFVDNNRKVLGRNYGTREVTAQNIIEARDQGYKGNDWDVCWDSLVDHELLHTIVWREVYNKDSDVLRHESGVAKCSYVERLWEETLVLSMQHYIVKGYSHAPVPYVMELLIRYSWRIRKQLNAVREVIGLNKHAI